MQFEQPVKEPWLIWYTKPGYDYLTLTCLLCPKISDLGVDYSGQHDFSRGRDACSAGHKNKLDYYARASRDGITKQRMEILASDAKAQQAISEDEQAVLRLCLDEGAGGREMYAAYICRQCPRMQQERRDRGILEDLDRIYHGAAEDSGGRSAGATSHASGRRSARTGIKSGPSRSTNPFSKLRTPQLHTIPEQRASNPLPSSGNSGSINGEQHLGRTVGVDESGSFPAQGVLGEVRDRQEYTKIFSSQDGAQFFPRRTTCTIFSSQDDLHNFFLAGRPAQFFPRRTQRI